MEMETSPTVTPSLNPGKRARSPSGDISLPAAKVPRISGGGLPINYLSKQLKEILPLVGAEETVTNILRLIGEYEGVLQRHESIAGNLGACPLGPILLKRFERLFDGPPRILKHHGRDANITWLDVVEFARNKPEQFNLEKTRNGVRVCQFYTKQSRVEISEEDYVLIASGMPQKLIPAQPILEDEEKELGVLEVLEANLGQVVQNVEQVASKGRQLIQRLKQRRSGIYLRREHERERGSGQAIARSASPMDINGLIAQTEVRAEASQSPLPGFMAVNMRQTNPSESENRPTWSSMDSSSNTPHALFPGANTDNVTIINGKSIKDASPTVRAELMKQFFTGAEDSAEDQVRASSSRHRPSVVTTSRLPRSSSVEMSTAYPQNSPSVAIPHTPAALMPQSKPSGSERDDGGPYKAEMMKRIENLPRGTRVEPPCDRCRRLHMDCIKNLTACLGCTRKHAKCSWKDVIQLEIGGLLGLGSDSDGSDLSPIKDHVDTVIMPPARMFPNLSTDRSSATGAGTFVSRDQATAILSSIKAPRLGVGPVAGEEQESETLVGQDSSSPRLEPGGDIAAEDSDDEGGDRLQALAARVYRSASQSQRPMDL